MTHFQRMMLLSAITLIFSQAILSAQNTNPAQTSPIQRQPINYTTAQPPPPPPPLPTEYGGPVGFPGPPGIASPYDLYTCPRCDQPGFFSSFEFGVVAPELTGSLAGPVAVGGVAVPVRMPFVDLDWTGSPRIELGYRFAEGGGSILASYRSVVSEGAENRNNFFTSGPAFLRTRLNMNIVDLGYASPDIPFAPFWDLKWNGGVRIGTAYFDTSAMNTTTSRRATNNFVGAGPQAGFAVRRQLDAAPGFAIFGKIDGALLFGEISQSFSTSHTVGGTSIGGASRFDDGQTVPVLGLQFGLSYAPPADPHWFQFSFGYLYEQWWDVGTAGASSTDVSFQGLFFRGEFNY